MPSAGEVERFAYCAHNWLLAQRGIDVRTAGSVRGIDQHTEVSRSHDAATSALREERSALKWMGLVLAMASSATFLTIELLFLPPSPHRWILVTLGLFLTGASAALLLIALLARRRAEHAVTPQGLRPDALAASGAAGSGPTLHDPDWDLRGTPDYILETSGGRVPVEVKTGRTPQRPYRSHVLQLASYLRLMEANGGVRPPYGLLQYPKGVFRVDWSPDLEQDLRDTLDRMAAAKMAGQADRDHDQPARCRGCARRASCTQSLA